MLIKLVCFDCWVQIWSEKKRKSLLSSFNSNGELGQDFLEKWWKERGITAAQKSTELCEVLLTGP